MDEVTRTQRSRTLSLWLRHKPERGGLTLSKDGWVAVDAILEGFASIEDPIDRAEFNEIVALDPKGRFEVERDRVRARYGHSIVLEEPPTPGMPPTLLYHGTPKRYVARILETGLRPMKRQFVHLSPDKKLAREVGRRRDQEPAILIIAAHEAYHAGIQFYPRGKGIWMSDPIPTEYITVMEEVPVVPQAAAPSGGGAGVRRRRPRHGFLKPER